MGCTSKNAQKKRRNCNLDERINLNTLDAVFKMINIKFLHFSIILWIK
jgi:hypothetical protein